MLLSYVSEADSISSTSLFFVLRPVERAQPSVPATVTVAVAFKSHPDNDLNTDIDTEARFANYQAVSGILIPFHFQQMINGSVVLDVIVTSAAVNTGLVDSLFNLP